MSFFEVLCTYRDGKKDEPRLRDLAHVASGSQDRESRNLGPALLTIPLFILKNIGPKKSKCSNNRFFGVIHVVSLSQCGRIGGESVVQRPERRPVSQAASRRGHRGRLRD